MLKRKMPNNERAAADPADLVNACRSRSPEALKDEVSSQCLAIARAFQFEPDVLQLLWGRAIRASISTVANFGCAFVL
jgi:hypothetical protein